jgi:hypothetical protein
VHLVLFRRVCNGWHSGRSTFLRHEFKYTYLSWDRLPWLQVCRCRPHFLYTNNKVVPQIVSRTPRPLSSLSCDSRYWLVYRPFDTRYSEILTVSINNPQLPLVTNFAIVSNIDIVPLFFHRNLWRCTKGGDVSKHCVIGDFSSKTFTGMWWWRYISGCQCITIVNTYIYIYIYIYTQCTECIYTGKFISNLLQ